MTLVEILKIGLEIVIQLALIIGVLALIYAVIWSAIFFPITKLRKHKQKVAEFEKEYNKIEVEFAATTKLKETTDQKLRQTLYVLAQKERELELMNAEISTKEKLKSSKSTPKTKTAKDKIK